MRQIQADNTGEQNKKSSLVSGIFQQNLVVYGSHIAKWIVVLPNQVRIFRNFDFSDFSELKNQRGDPWVKKNIFSKSVSNFG